MRTPSRGPSSARHLVAAALFLAALSPLRASAQSVYTVTSTYQASLQRYDTGFNATEGDFRSWGLMAGMMRPGHWWSPHVWVQHYTRHSLCPSSSSNSSIPNPCDDTGWMVSVGPEIRLVSHGPWWSAASADVDLNSGTGGAVNGSAGLQVGVRLGAFTPQVFARVGRFRGYYHDAIGVGLRLELR